MQHHCVSLATQTKSSALLLSSIGRLTKLTSLTLHCSDSEALHVQHSLSTLCSLQELHLTNVILSPHSLSDLSSLVSLTMAVSRSSILDLRWHSQLTSLTVGATHASDDCQLLLPASQHQALQSLQLRDHCSVMGLSAATALSSLVVSSMSMADVPWPTQLRKLQRLSVTAKQAADASQVTAVKELPYEWHQYSTLTYLSVEHFSADNLPSWFGRLSLLQQLALPNARFSDFPDAILQLTKLVKLDLSSLQLPQGVRCDRLATLPCLTFLDMGFRLRSRKGLDADLDEVDHDCHPLRVLSSALAVRKPALVRCSSISGRRCWATY